MSGSGSIRKLFCGKQKNMKLTKLEKETIINFNEEEDFADIYTSNSHLKSRLAEICKDNPESCQLEAKDTYGFVRYRIDKNLISVRKPWSMESRQKAKERMLFAGVTPPKRNA